MADDTKLDPKAVEERRKICANCLMREEGKCKLCGCPLEKKTEKPTNKCPVNKW